MQSIHPLIIMNDSIPSLWDAAIPRAIQNTFAMHNIFDHTIDSNSSISMNDNSKFEHGNLQTNQISKCLKQSQINT